MGLGVIYARKVLGRRLEQSTNNALGLLSVHPHASHWIDIAALVQDGVAYSRGRRNAVRGPQEENSPARERHKESRQKTPPKDQSSKRTTKRQKKEKERSESEGLGEPLQSQSANTVAGSEAVGVAPVAHSVPSGGGGRWVHVKD